MTKTPISHWVVGSICGIAGILGLLYLLSQDVNPIRIDCPRDGVHQIRIFEETPKMMSAECVERLK